MAVHLMYSSQSELFYRFGAPFAPIPRRKICQIEMLSLLTLRYSQRYSHMDYRQGTGSSRQVGSLGEWISYQLPLKYYLKFFHASPGGPTNWVSEHRAGSPFFANRLGFSLT